MDLASKALSRQRKIFVSLAVKGLFLTLLGSYVGVMLMIEGTGASAKGTGGKAEALLNLVTKIVGDKADPEKIMEYILVAVMVYVVGFGIYYLIKGSYHMLTSHTPLGISLLQQAKSYEKLSDMVSAVDADLNRGVQTYGNVSIGREWILEEVAMRISNIRGVFWKDEGEADYMMYCVDESKNVWAAFFTYQDDREHAIQSMKARFPELVYGDQDACTAFIKSL